MELPSVSTLRNIFDRLKANDIAWFKDQWKSGSFGWMKDRLPAGEYDNIGKSVEAGDLAPMKGALGKLDLPGIDMFKGLAGNVTGAAGNITGNVTGAAGNITGNVTGAAGKIAGNVTGAAGNLGGAVTGNVTGAAGKVAGAVTGGAGKLGGAAAAGVGGAAALAAGNKKKKGFLWLLPLIIGAIVLGWLLTQCGGSKDAVITDTTVAVEAPVEEVPVETVAAEVAPETVAAEVAPETVAAVETTVAVAAPAEGDLLSVASANGSFKTLTAAVGASSLVPTLQGAGPFTIFAPTDEAFAKLPAGLVEALLKPENKGALDKILSYHVVSGKVMAADVVAGDAPSVEGSALKLVTEGGVMVNDAKVLTADVAASNGVIHVIDTVLVPASVDAASLLAAPAVDTTVAAAPAAAAPENLTVYFGNASSAIDAAAQAKIDGAVATLKALPAGSKVAIVGHASPAGNAAQNEALSIKRAGNVEAALKAGLGADASKIEFSVDAKGDTQPDTDEAKSRKVTIEIAPTA